MEDRFGLRVSARSAAALAHYERAVDAQLHGWPGVLPALADALAEDPGFALAHALRTLALLARNEGAAARAALAEAKRLAATTGVADERERAHVALVAAIVEGRPGEALRQVIAHAQRFPADVLAASTALGAYGLFAFSGRDDHDAARLAFTEALAAHHRRDFPWLLAQRGWARIEAGRVAEGLAMAQEAIGLRRDNAFNAHIVVHGHHEAGSPCEVVAFVDGWLPDYPREGPMWGHLHWHAALSLIEQGDLEGATARLLGPLLEHLAQGYPYMGLADGASLCWRLALHGVAALPWLAMREHAARHFAAGSNVFGELHLAMIAAAHRDAAALRTVARRLESIGERGHPGAAVGLLWVGALRALVEGQSDEARQQLQACEQAAVRLGGSRAQRGIVALTGHAPRPPAAWGWPQHAA